MKYEEYVMTIFIVHNSVAWRRWLDDEISEFEFDRIDEARNLALDAFEALGFRL